MANSSEVPDNSARALDLYLDQFSSIFNAFDKNNRKPFVDFCKHIFNTSYNDKHHDIEHTEYYKQRAPYWQISRVVTKICYAAVHGHASIEKSVLALSEILTLGNDLSCVIADTLVNFDIYSQSVEDNVRGRFLPLLKACCGKLVAESTLKERIEFETLGDAGIIKAYKITQTKFIKIKTRLFYKQRKYNLFREESEGYAKLIIELNPVTGCTSRAKYVLEAIKSLIGCFNLDPNRVLDIILESFECRPDKYDFFIYLLRSFSSAPTTLNQLIGFKFSFYEKPEDKTPESLFHMVALLIKEELLHLNDIYGLLKPDDSEIVNKQKDEYNNALLYVKQLNSLSTTMIDKTAVKPQSEDSSMDVDTTEGNNQKLGLLAALLDISDWNHAEKLMCYFPDYYAVSHEFIAKKLCILIHCLSENLYSQTPSALLLTENKRWRVDTHVTLQEINHYDELFERVFPIIFSLGPSLHVDPILMAKIIRLSRQYILQKDTRVADNNIVSIIHVIDEALLPALSLMDCNCCLAEELWTLLKLFPYKTRYLCFSRWKALNSTHPLLIKKKAEMLKKLKYIMKRLSKENVKPSGRQIGKLSHTNPADLFDYILSQIQTWDNLIIPVVDSLKYLTSLSYDVLAYCIITALANPEKDRMKHDGTSISMWLQSLANFSGAIFKKYPIDIAGLLQFVANQLKSEKSVDLLILKEIVQKMAGIEAIEEMTTEQVEAMTGGELLRTEGGYFNQLRNVKKSSQRLKDALLDQGLAVPLCLLMSQQRNGIFFEEQEQTHLKLLGKLYDQCQDTTVQFGNFLASNLNMDDYVSRIPPILALLTEYNIDADLAFFLVRPTFNYSIDVKFEELTKDKLDKSTLSQKYLEAVHCIVNPIVESLWSIDCLRPIWEDLSPQIYFTFWSLSVYDLAVPTKSYEREITKLKVISQNEENKDANKKKKEKERCDALIAKLTEEEKMQQEHCALVSARLKSEKDMWFNAKSAKIETITQFLQLCLFPRCIFSPVDAVYCAKFLHLIHYLKAPHFSTLLCYDRIFCDTTYTITVCTENQANRYGLFLCTMLETVMRWHNDKNVFDKECAFFPGFMTKFKGAATQGSHDSSDHVDYENYRHVCHKWHFKLTKAFLSCLDSGNFIQIRNALLVLIKVNPYFPVVSNLGLAIDNRIQKIRNDEKDKRHDLSALATGYSGLLKLKKASFIPENEFHMKEPNRNIKTENKVETKSENMKPSTKGEVTRVVSTRSTSHEKSNVIVSSSSNVLSSKIKVKDVDHNGIVEGGRVSKQTSRVKEDKGETGGSPMRKEDRISSKSESKGERSSRERRSGAEDYEKVSKSASENDGSNIRDSHNRHRSSDVDGEREHKRRRTENTSSKSPRDIERETHNFEKSKDDEKNGSAGREKNSDKSHKESSEISSEKTKKKTTRKREYSNDAQESRRRRIKTDDGDSEKRSSDSRREEKSPIVYVTGNSQESSRRTDRDEKRYRRSSSVTTSKKRS